MGVKLNASHAPATTGMNECSPKRKKTRRIHFLSFFRLVWNPSSQQLGHLGFLRNHTQGLKSKKCKPTLEWPTVRETNGRHLKNVYVAMF